jgi:hypothetical protein
MKALKIVLYFVLFLLAIVLIVPLFLGKTYSVSKTTSVNKPKTEVYDFMADFNTFDNWSPWNALDPNINTEVKGEPKTVGSSYHWQGNKDVGKGSMTITELTEDKISIFLEFIEPFQSTSPTEYIIKPISENETSVTWTMSGEMKYPFNLFLLFMDMEDAIGKDFDKGLLALKSELEN